MQIRQKQHIDRIVKEEAEVSITTPNPNPKLISIFSIWVSISSIWGHDE